ncbi:PAS domain-containing hybrid sensor histidine kinase/response regulator [Sphaerotilus uruguayifluvii]|uniref:histidine kinase n=1 Tax=Sphaerotilus uruguayifluvii TaxID=2735897 RepID=A0ABX2G7S3_9BURK|nr:response regulator [Leptothrix sp. C29]NRT58075.1 PAS domain S-box-containing protein [Leptothrix sp. C29]
MPTSPASLSDPAQGPDDAVSDAVLALSRRLQQAASLQDGLCLAAPELRRWTGATGAVLLRVDEAADGSALVRPWPVSGRAGEEMIDLDSLRSVRSDATALGQVLARRAPVQAPAERPGPPWRAGAVRGVLVLPVVEAGRLVAALELHDPAPLPSPPWRRLDAIGLQLAHLAERDRLRDEVALGVERLARLELLAARIGRGAVITDARGRVEWAHPGFAQVTGHAASRLRGRLLWELLPGLAAGDDVRPALMLRECLLRGEDFVREFVARRGVDDVLPGDPYWLEIDARVVIDTVERLPRVVCVCRDVTDRKEREFGIDEGRALLAVLTEHIPISLVVLDAQQFRVVSLNRQAELEFAASSGQAGGWGVDELLGGGVQAQLQPHLVQALGCAGAVEHEFCRASADGDRLFSARHVAVRNRLGRPTVLICQLRDITQQRRDAQQLRESEERYRELVEAIDEGVFFTSSRPDAPGHVGARVLDLLGLPGLPSWPADGLLSLRVLPQDRPLLERQREQERQDGASDLTLRIRHPVHGLRWLRQRTRVRHLPGGETRVYGLLDDVTEERERELQLQAARDAAEAASRAKSQFMATMSHEIRTPMNGILGMTELLLGTRLDERQRRFAQSVYRSGETLLEIINDVLDFAKIEAGRLELVPAEFGLRALVEDTLELMSPRAHEKGLELGLHDSPDLPAVIRADALRLRQVLTNLISNAIKFTEHGDVTVALSCLPAPAGADPGTLTLLFEVRDTGIGIAPEAVPRLFTAFTQVHEGMARRYGGTGLGLAISRQLVELMGGTIEVESRPGVGSVFRFAIPAGPVPATGTPAADPSGPAASVGAGGVDDGAPMPGLKVLVVDDHETNRTVLENLLGAWGLRVTLADGAQPALALLRQQALHAGDAPFDLLLIDWHMPDMDGIALARQIRAEGLAAQARRVLLSSVAAPDDARIAREAGFDLFLHKPVRKTELRQVILGIGAEVRPAGELVVPQFGASVLVVEDNPVNQEVMGQMLQRLGCAVRVAGSAMEGLRQLCERRFDLVLMDIQMPGMDGIEALRCLRSGPDARWRFVTPRRTPVIAVTANALEGDEDRFLSLGFDAYLAKPYRQGQLLAVLGRFLGDRLGPGGGAVVEAAARTLPGELAPDRLDDELGRIERSLRLDLPDEEPGAELAPLLDPQAMRRLHDLDPDGRNQLVRRVMQAFDASITRMLPMLDPGPLGQDPAAVRHVTHTLRSSAASLGALRLSALCTECDQALRQGGDARTLAGLLQGLRAEMIRIQEGVRQRLEAMSPAAATGRHE